MTQLKTRMVIYYLNKCTFNSLDQLNLPGQEMQGTFSVVAKSYSLHLNVQTVHSFISVRFDPTVARIKDRKEKKKKHHNLGFRFGFSI